MVSIVPFRQALSPNLEVGRQPGSPSDPPVSSYPVLGIHLCAMLDFCAGAGPGQILVLVWEVLSSLLSPPVAVEVFFLILVSTLRKSLTVAFFPIIITYI